MHTHFVATVIWRINTEGEIEFLVIDYVSTNPRNGQRTALQTKFPGGTNKECASESIDATRDREVLEETGLITLNSREVWRKEVAWDHTKYGFLCSITDCKGNLRKESITDDGDELSSPYWISAKTLGRILFHSHQELYMAAMRELRLY